MAEIEYKATEGQTFTSARAIGTTALGANAARVVVETSGWTTFEIMQALREILADIEASERKTSGGRLSAVAFADNSRFADGSSFADQNVLGL